MRTLIRTLAGLVLSLLSLLLMACSPQAQGALTTLDTPQGGRIVYGQVTGETTEAGAMGAVLRNIHTSVGDRPQVSRLFQVRGTQSVAAFFSVNNRNANAGPLKGLLIVTKVETDNVQAALITDSAAHFDANYNAAQERNAIQNSSVYQRWDSQDRRSREFSNFQLGYTAVQDNQNNTHGTAWNADADALVRQNPQRFEYVNAPDFWKGVDY